jgi:broad specificity phosphatase PhoE
MGSPAVGWSVPLRLVLVRHGLSSFNLERRIQGRDDLSLLSDQGLEQARRCGQALQGIELSVAYCSPLRRARDTARQLIQSHAGATELIERDDLLEIDLAPWSGLLRDELRQHDPEGERCWREEPHRLELQGTAGRRYNPVLELMEQAGDFVDTLLRRHADVVEREALETILVVAHNGILRCVLLRLLGLPASCFSRLRLDNGSISVLNLHRSVGADPSVQIESLNSIFHLNLPLPPRATGPRMVLVRHGETEWNREGRFQGQIDIPLNTNGVAQAEAAGRFLADVPLSRAYTSPMARPRQTAERILVEHPGVPLTCHSGLVEIGHGLWEGQLEREIAASWPELLADWKRAPHTVQMPEGENLQQVWDRSLEAWQRIARSLNPEETALVVAHDAVNKTILCSLLGLGPESIWSVKQGNGGVTVVDYPRGGDASPVVSGLNFMGHLGGVLDRTAAGAL